MHAVLFDFHTTLVDGGDPYEWLDLAVAATGAAPPAHLDAAAHFLDNVWEHAGDIDPASTRDLSPADHRRVFDALMEHAREAEGVDISPPLADELYRIMPDQWHPYADALPVLRSLAAADIPVALISNVGIEIADILATTGLAACLDAVVLSCHVGTVKPDPRIFSVAVEALGVEPAHCLMVGDSAVADVGAAAIGVRTLILPRSTGRVRGLEVVCRIAGVACEAPEAYRA